MARIPGTFDFSANLEVNKQGPLDARLTVESKSELTGLPFAYIGMIVAVTSDTTPENNGVYVLEDTDCSSLANWTLIGSGNGEGSSGTSGTSGVNGQDGAQGADGAPGTSGTSGTNGTDGAQGADGADGVPGTSGTSGTNGTDGAQGADGAPGTSGTSGINGEQGADGAPGTSGTSGVNGEPGSQGDPGQPGTSGTSGVNGEQGADGAPGTSGTSGVNGANGISAGRSYYFNQSEDSDIISYKILSETPTVVDPQIITVGLAGNQQGVLVQQFITPELGFTLIPAGVQRFKLYFNNLATNANVDAYVTLELAAQDGVTYGNAITSGIVNLPYNGGVPIEVDIDVVFPAITISLTDRMIVKIYLDNQDSTSRTIEWSTEDGYYSYVITSVGVVSGTSGNSGTSGVNGEPGPNGTSGTSGTSGIGVPTGGTVGQVLSKATDTDYDIEWIDAPSGGASTNTYIARAEFDSTQNLKGVYFLDPSGTGLYSTAGAGVAPPEGNLATFSFNNQLAPPVSILAYAANTATNEYIITHLNAGGDNLVYKLGGFTFTSYSSALGEPNQYDANIFNTFGTATMTLDLAKANFDWNRLSFPVAKEAHIYIVFKF